MKSAPNNFTPRRIVLQIKDMSLRSTIGELKKTVLAYKKIDADKNIFLKKGNKIFDDDKLSLHNEGI